MDQKERSDRIMTLQANIWWRSFLDDPMYGHYKLKRLWGSEHPSREPRMSIVPVVEYEEFRSIEKDRLPFLTWTQTGITPRPEEVFNDAEERTAVILCYSVFSGCMNEVTIYRFKGPKAVEELNSIRFPHHIKMTEILDIPFPEVLQVEFGFKKQSPLYSKRAEVARTPVQQFQNMCYRDDFVPRKKNLGRARSMLLVNEFKGATTMHLLNKARYFELGYFTFNSFQFMTGCGTIPATETIGIGQSVKSFPEAYVLLTPVDFYNTFRKRYHGQVDWDGIKLSFRQLTFEDDNNLHLLS